MTTTTAQTLQRELDAANPNTIADCLRRVKLGTLLAAVKQTFTLASVANVVTLSPPALLVKTCRITDITGGTAAAAGPVVMTDAGGTALPPYVSSGLKAPGVALLSDDGSTITFDGTIKAAIVEWIPQSNAAVSSAF